MTNKQPRNEVLRHLADKTKTVCHNHGIAVYQVGEVYGDAPPATLRKWFVAVTGSDFQNHDIAAIPLAENEADAYRIAAHALKLNTD